MADLPPLERGRSYAAPEGAGPRWFRDELGRVLEQGWLHPIVVTLRLSDGTHVTRALEAVDDLRDENGTAYLEESGRDELLAVPCSEIVAFQVQGNPSIDHSDELGRE